MKENYLKILLNLIFKKKLFINIFIIILKKLKCRVTIFRTITNKEIKIYKFYYIINFFFFYFI